MESLLDIASWESVTIDATDVIHHFRANTRVSGIQRVTVQLALPFLQAGARASVFDEAAGEWRTVETSALLRLFDLSRHAASGDARWLQAVAAIEEQQVPTPFPARSLLLSLGANWSVDRMFMAVRQLQASVGLTYAAAIHDTVPLRFPELCASDVVRSYRLWLAAVVENADVLVVTSDAVRQDLRLACSRSGLRPRAVLSCPLAGSMDWSPPPRRDSPRSHIDEVLARPFVLFVGTIEPRKDHLFVLNCWRHLLAQRGPDATPVLVLVGKLGWRYEPVLTALDDPALRDSVRLFTDLSDEDVTRLYDGCLFTVYNSLHEGWGLPVTESIGRGRIPLIPRHSGLLDSGAGCALYFSPGSASDFTEKAARLIDDPAFRGACERDVLVHRALKPWADIAAGLAEGIAGAAREPRRPIRAGVIYALSSKLEGQDLGLHAQAEALRFSGFHQLEGWGAWTSAPEFTLSGSLEADSPAARRPEEAVDGAFLAHLIVKVMRSRSRLTFFVNLRRSRDAVELEPGRFCLQVAVDTRATTGAFALSVRQDRLHDLTDLGDGRAVGVGLEALMLCRPSDIAARMTFLEYFSGYRAVPFS